MDSDPYAPKTPPAVAAETQSDLDLARARLEGIGATPDEIEQFVAEWDVFDDQWTPERRHAWLRARDTDLIADLQAARMEYEVGTVTEEEHDAKVAEAEHQALVDEAAAIISAPIPSILGWVGDDAARARAVYVLETSDDGANRKGILDGLARFDLGTDDDDQVQVIE